MDDCNFGFVTKFLKTTLELATMVSRELEPNRNLFRDHLPFILHGGFVGTGEGRYGFRG
jgi:hypothetical protein